MASTRYCSDEGIDEAELRPRICCPIAAFFHYSDTVFLFLFMTCVQ